MNSDFQKQYDRPLYPDILWNRPLNRMRGGLMLVVGGHKGNFSQLQNVFAGAEACGIGECGLVVPDALQPILGPMGIATFVPSSTSGSLGRAALGEILHLASDFDVTLVGLNLSNNSETAILTEELLKNLPGRLIVTGEALTASPDTMKHVAARPDTLLAITPLEAIQLSTILGQKAGGSASEGVVGKVKIIRALAEHTPADILMYGPEIIIRSGVTVTVTDMPVNPEVALGLMYGVLGAFWTQQRTKPLEGLTTGAYVLQEGMSGAQNLAVSAMAEKVRATINSH